MTKKRFTEIMKSFDYKVVTFWKDMNGAILAHVVSNGDPITIYEVYVSYDAKYATKTALSSIIIRKPLVITNWFER